MGTLDVSVAPFYLSSSAVVRRHFYSVQRVLARLLIDGDSYSRDAGHGAFFYDVALESFFCVVLAVQ